MTFYNTALLVQAQAVRYADPAALFQSLGGGWCIFGRQKTELAGGELKLAAGGTSRHARNYFAAVE